MSTTRSPASSGTIDSTARAIPCRFSVIVRFTPLRYQYELYSTDPGTVWRVWISPHASWSRVMSQRTSSSGIARCTGWSPLGSANAPAIRWSPSDSDGREVRAAADPARVARDQAGAWSGLAVAQSRPFAEQRGSVAHAVPRSLTLRDPQSGAGLGLCSLARPCPTAHRADHRGHRSGRLLPGRTTAGAGIRGTRNGPALVDGAVRSDRARPRSSHPASGRSARSALAGRRPACRAPG